MEGWEEPLHPGPLRDLYPTSSHTATPIAHFLPQMSTNRPRAAPNRPLSGGFTGARRAGGSRARMQDGVRERALHGRVQQRARSVREVCVRWDAVGGRGGRRGAPSAALRQTYSAPKIDSGSSALTTYWPASTISEIRRSAHRLHSR
ncbi:MAG: hypothetical protein QOC78_1807 [Solirubrobacteraceae bacterium]|nr:hypothetical protein [Solirubrobacteraceae bacterium]